MQLRVKVCCAELALISSHVSLCAAIRPKAPKALTLLITCFEKGQELVQQSLVI